MPLSPRSRPLRPRFPTSMLGAGLCIFSGIAVVMAVIGWLLVSLVGFGAQPKVIGGVKYATFGVLDQDSMRNPDIEYTISSSSVIWCVVFSETLVVPALIIAYDLWEPVGPAIHEHGEPVKGAIHG